MVDIDEKYEPWNVSRGEDVIQSFALFHRAKKIVFINRLLYFYRKNEGSVTLRVRVDDWKNYLTWADRTFLYLGMWEMKQEVYTDFAARQMSHFYYYLRDIASKAVREKDRTMLVRTVRELGSDGRYQRILQMYDYNCSNPRLRARLRLLRWGMTNSRWRLVCVLLRLSNLLGGN